MSNRPSAPGRDDAFPIDITEAERQAGFHLGEIARLGGYGMPFGMTSPSKTIQAAVRYCGGGLHSVKTVRPMDGTVMYAIFGEKNGTIEQGAKADAAFSLDELLNRFPAPPCPWPS